MGYYVSNMIGIRTGGVFAGPVDIDDLRARIGKVARSLLDTANEAAVDESNPSHCTSPELVGNKGGYVVVAGVFNYWRFVRAAEFARLLSEEFGTEVMVMSWDMQTDEVGCQIFLAGKPLLEVNENPLGQILRRIAH